MKEKEFRISLILNRKQKLIKYFIILINISLKHCLSKKITMLKENIVTENFLQNLDVTVPFIQHINHCQRLPHKYGYFR